MFKTATRLTASTPRETAATASRAPTPPNAASKVDQLLRRSEAKPGDTSKVTVDVFEASKDAAIGAATRRTPRDNGIISSLDDHPASGTFDFEPNGAMNTARMNMDALREQLRSGLNDAGMAGAFGMPRTTKPGADLVTDRLATVTGTGTDLGPATDVPGFGAPVSLLGARTAGEFSRNRLSADDSKGEEPKSESASEATIKALSDAAAKVPGAVKEFAIGAAGAILPFVAGVFAGIGLGTRDDASARDTAGGIVGALTGATLGSQSGDNDPLKKRSELTDPGLDRGDGPSDTTRERAAGRRDGLVNPAGNVRELDPSKLAAATITAVRAKVNPSPVGRDAPVGPIVAPDSGASDPTGPGAVRGGKVVVPGGPPRA